MSGTLFATFFVTSRKVWTKIPVQGVSFTAAESSVIGVDHAEVGAQILKNWLFPPDIVNAVRWHHDTNSCYKPSKSVDVVHVANVLCLMTGIGIGKEDLHHDLEASAVDRLKLKASQIELVPGETVQ